MITIVALEAELYIDGFSRFNLLPAPSMIEKFVKIKNLGRFTNYSATGDTSLRKVSEIYGENGRGKTTLTAILRSLRSGEPEAIAQRKTLGGSGNPHVDLRVDGALVTFENSAWTATCPTIEIYDPVFVSENVHSGEEVEHEQRRNLHRFAIGEAGVRLACEIERIDAQSRALSSDIREQESKISPQTDLLTVGAFAKLPTFEAMQITQAREKLEQLKVELKPVEQIETVNRRQLPSEINVGLLPIDETRAILSRLLANVSVDAERRVQEHLRANLSEGGEEWLSYGFRFHKSDECPFCAQTLETSPVFEAYKTLFSSQYQTFKGELAAHAAKLNGIPLPQLRYQIQLNRTILETWLDDIKMAVLI